MRSGIGSELLGLVKKSLLVAMLLASLGIAARAATLRSAPTTSTWSANGPVCALACTTDTIYLGGDFSYVGPANGCGLPLDTATGQPTSVFPKVNGIINACLPDGAGGWFIGGYFHQVGSLPRNNIAHILADGGVDASWNPDAIDGVLALAASGGKLFVGGNFTSIGGTPHKYLAALDPASGAAIDWNLDTDGPVMVLTISGGTLYTGGAFTNICGQRRSRLAALDLASGDVTAWAPYADNRVSALAVSGSTVYAGGDFSSIGGKYRIGLAALDATSGTATAWNPGMLGPVRALAVSGQRVYAAGNFTWIGTQYCGGVVGLDAVSGAVTAWNPRANGGVYAMVISDGLVYVGGDFTTIGGQSRHHLAALDLTSGTVIAWRPHTSGRVLTLAASGGRLYAGGEFNSAGGQVRNHLAALDASSGMATVWNPDVNDRVSALAISGGTVYVGGQFSQIGGRTRNRVAAVDAASGAVTGWNPNADGTVYALASSAGSVYAGGAFTHIGGQARNFLAALNLTSGTARSWNPGPIGYVYALAASGATVYAGGRFTTIGGQTRNRLAALDAASGAVAAWDPNVADGEVHALLLSGQTIYTGGTFTRVGGKSRYCLAALDAGSGAVISPFVGDAGSPVDALAVANGNLYVGGQFLMGGGAMRKNLAELDATSGTVSNWSPNPDYQVQALASLGGTLYVGGLFYNIGGQSRSYFARFDPQTSPTAPMNPGVTAVQPDRLTWTWTDASDNEDGFKVWADPGLTTPTTLRTTTVANATSWFHGGLSPNTPYTFQVAASNAAGDSARSNLCTTWTLLQPLGSLAFTSVSATGLSVAPTATLSNLTSGSSGLLLANTTIGTDTGWRQGAEPWTLTGLTPNTQYAFSGRGRNGAGVENAPVSAVCTTLAAAPVVGGNVSCDHAPGPLYPNGTAFGFFNPAGFGSGTHGGSPLKVSAFRYVWDTAPTHAFAGSEPQWSSDVLTLKPTATARWYLHLQSVNAAGVAGAPLNYGPFDYDLTPPVALSNTLSTPTWATNGEVKAILRTLDTIYLGGSFNYVGPATGCGVPLSMVTGQPAGPFPRVDGLLNTCAPDGAGGWYIGGSFSRVGTLARACLAHILADGRVDPAWNPNANGAIYALARSGGTVYAGGTFTSVGGQTRNYLAALDAASGDVMAWTPNPNGSVGALAVSGAKVYAGGTFTSIGGQPRNRLAAMDMANGTATAWDPDANGSVSTLAVSAGTIYASGLFTSIGGQARNKLAALDASSGVATAWDPNPNNPVFAMVVSGSIVYAGGAFTSIGGQARNHLAALDVSSGAATAWDPNVSGGSYPCIYALAVSGGTVYAGGSFTSIGGRPRSCLAAVDASSGTATAWNPGIGGTNTQVEALASSAGTVYAGGNLFISAGQPQSCFAQFDPITPPAAPANPGVTEIHTDRLTWAWTDASFNEDGFKVYAGPGAAAPAAVTSTTQAEGQSFVMRGLMPNTQYAFQVAATNAAGDSAKTGVITTFTLAAEPMPGQNLQASTAPGAAQPLGAAFVFSNPMGFGFGRVSAFRWAWDQTTTHSFSGGEPLWNSGSLTLTPASVGSYYLHLQSVNAAGVANPATLDLGAFVVVVPPSITTHPASRTINPGTAVSFSVAATGTAPLSCQWFKDGSALADGARITGAKTASLNLSNAAWGDSGLYACRISNAAGSTTSTAARLIVNPTLTIVSAHGAPSPAAGVSSYTSGTLITARVPTATIYDPADSAGTTRWVCIGWTATGSAPASGTGASVSFKLTQPTTLTWLWKTQYKLTATASPSSRGAVRLADGLTAANGTWQDADATVLLRAIPNSGSRFAFWWGALSSHGNPASLLMNQPKTLNARFDARSNGVLDWLAYP